MPEYLEISYWGLRKKVTLICGCKETLVFTRDWRWRTCPGCGTRYENAERQWKSDSTETRPEAPNGH